MPPAAAPSSKALRHIAQTKPNQTKPNQTKPNQTKKKKKKKKKKKNCACTFGGSRQPFCAIGVPPRLDYGLSMSASTWGAMNSPGMRLDAVTALPVAAPSPRRDLIAAALAFSAALLSWAAAGTWWASSGPAVFYLSFACGVWATGCVPYADFSDPTIDRYPPQNYGPVGQATPVNNVAFVNLQGACACLVLAGLIMVAVSAVAAWRALAPAALASGLPAMLPRRLATASVVALALAIMGVSLPSTALSLSAGVALNGPGMAVAIAAIVLIVAVWALLGVGGCCSACHGPPSPPAAEPAASKVAAQAHATIDDDVGVTVARAATLTPM